MKDSTSNIPYAKSIVGFPLGQSFTPLYRPHNHQLRDSIKSCSTSPTHLSALYVRKFGSYMALNK